MASKRKSNPLVGGFAIFFIVIGAAVSAFQRNPLLGVVLGAGLLGLLVLIVYALRPKRCEVCNNLLQRKSYIWEIQGAKKKVCPHCNTTLARRQSKAAMSNTR